MHKAMWNCFVLLCFLLLYVGVGLVVVAFTLPFWREYKVNSAHARDDVGFNFTGREYLNYNRYQGLYRVCFPGTAALPDVAITSDFGGKRGGGLSGHHTFASPIYQCAGLNWDFSKAAGSETAQLGLQWAAIVLYALAFVPLAAYIPLSLLALKFRLLRFAFASIGTLLTAAALLIISIICSGRMFRVIEAELWPEGVELFTTASYSSGYFVAWAGVVLLLFAAAEFGLFAKKFAREDAREKAYFEKDNDAGRRDSVPVQTKVPLITSSYWSKTSSVRNASYNAKTSTLPPEDA